MTFTFFVFFLLTFIMNSYRFYKSNQMGVFFLKRGGSFFSKFIYSLALIIFNFHCDFFFFLATILSWKH